MASFMARTMGYRQTPEEPERPLIGMTTQGRPDENLALKAPQTLKESNPSMMKRLIPQFLLLIIPACFIALGACIFQINGKGESKNGETIMQAIKLSSTLWPIAFAAVVGPMIKAMALYFAERGTSLGTLEVVFGSQTLVSTLRGCFSLRIFSLWILVIAAVWTLSPAGGQGVSRALELQRSRISHDIKTQSFPINNLSYSGDTFTEGSSSMGSLFNSWSSLGGAAFLSPDVGLMHSNGSSDNFKHAVLQAGGDALAINSSRTDLWKNVRIPILHLLPDYMENKPFQWVDVSSDTVPPYDSLIGIPIRGMTSTAEGNGTTIVSSYYHYLSCNSWVNKTEWLRENPKGLQSAEIVNGRINSSASDWNSGFPNIFMDILNDTTRQAHPLAEPNKKQALVFSTGRSIAPGNITLCEITTSYVDSKVNCTRPSNGGELSCAAKAIRHTKDRPVSGNLTAFDIPFTFQMLKEIPFVLASRRGGSPEPGFLEVFLKDPPSIVNLTSLSEEQWNYENLPLEVFSARLSMLINTFLRASLEMSSVVGMKSINLDNDTHWMDTNATWKEFTAPKYVIKESWFRLYIFSTIVMTLCALANIVLRGMTRAPDFLGSISALTRDSPFVDTPAGGSVMDGTERAKLLKDKWVRIQDVKPDDDVGRIAFSDAKESGRLRVDRKYE